MNQRRFYLSMGLFFAALGVVEAVLCHVLDIQGAIGILLGQWPVVLLCGTCSLATAPFPRLREAPLLLMLSTLSWQILAILSMAATRAVASAHLADHRLTMIDAAIGFRTASIVQVVRHYPWVDALSTMLYWRVLLVEMLAVLLVLPVIRHAQSTRFYLAAMTVGAILTTLLSLFTPAIGPWSVQGFTPTDYQTGWTMYILRLRSTGPMLLNMREMGVVSFPSFHCTFALLTAYALSCIRWLRWPLWITAGLICLSTLTTGSHYLVDVLGGVALVYPAILIARLAVPAAIPPPTGRLAAAPSEAPRSEACV